MEKYEEAIQAYTDEIELLPDNAKALNNRAFCLAKLDMYEQAVMDYSLVLE